MPSPLCDLPVFSCFTPEYARNYTGEHRDSKIFFFNCPSFSFHLKISFLTGETPVLLVKKSPFVVVRLRRMDVSFCNAS
jgi:hypothetical protein